MLSNNVLDAALDYITQNATHVYLCSQAPATHTEASATYALGSKAITAGSPGAGDPNGRQVTIPAFTDGVASATGTATHYAVTRDTGGEEELIAVEELASPVALTNGQAFPLSAIVIRIPAPAS